MVYKRATRANKFNKKDKGEEWVLAYFLPWDS